MSEFGSDIFLEDPEEATYQSPARVDLTPEQHRRVIHSINEYLHEVLPTRVGGSTQASERLARNRWILGSVEAVLQPNNTNDGTTNNAVEGDLTGVLPYAPEVDASEIDRPPSYTEQDFRRSIRFRRPMGSATSSVVTESSAMSDAPPQRQNVHQRLPRTQMWQEWLSFLWFWFSVALIVICLIFAAAMIVITLYFIIQLYLTSVNNVLG